MRYFAFFFIVDTHTKKMIIKIKENKKAQAYYDTMYDAVTVTTLYYIGIIHKTTEISCLHSSA